MNINTAASFQMPCPKRVKAGTEQNQPDSVEKPVIEERVRLAIEKLQAPAVTGLTMDDLEAVEDFIEKSPLGAGYVGLYTRIDSFRFTILWAKECRAADALKTIDGIYTDFKANLHSLWPKLADKAFGYTVAEDGQLQVTAPPNMLTAWEQDTLNTLLNQRKDLQSLSFNHAKAVIELVQLDKKQFEGKVTLDLTNFHRLIDYGLLLNKGALDLRSTDSWLDQLYKKAKEEPIEKKQGLHIQV
jgi:hypothetical protein